MEERELDEEVGSTIKIRTKKDGLNDIVDTAKEERGIVEEEEELEEEVVFTLPDSEEDREEFADLTPEQAAELMREREEEEQKRKALTEKLLAEGEEYLQKGDRINAEEKFYNAVEASPASVETNLRYAAVRTNDFTDFTPFENFRDAYDDGESRCGEDFRLAVKERYGDPIFRAIKTYAEKAEPIAQEVLAKREERRLVFKRDAVKRRKAFYLSLLPVALFLVLTIVFATQIMSVKEATFLILTIAFGAATLIAFVVFLFCTRAYNTAKSRVSANERDESTKLGRELASLKEKISYLSEIVK